MRITRYWNEVLAYWRDAETAGDFVRLMRVRLALSKGVGRLVCPRPIIVRVNLRSMGGPVWLRSHTSDICVLYEQVVAEAYGAIIERAPEARTIVDLGANVGLAARWLLARCPDARVIAVEPDPGNAEMLRRNLDDYHAAVVEACVGATERSVSLVSETGEWGYQMTDTPGSIPVLTLSRILAEHDFEQVDVLKCDIEGAERELFADCDEWIDRVGMMVVECHGFPASELLKGRSAEWSMTPLGRYDPHKLETVALTRVCEDTVRVGATALTTTRATPTLPAAVRLGVEPH